MKLGVTRVPGSAVFFEQTKARAAGEPGGNYVPYIGAGAWFAALTSDTSAREAAFDFLTYLIGPQVSLETLYEPAWGGRPTRYSHFDLNNRAG